MALVKPVPAALKEAFLECHAEGHQWRHEAGTIGTDDPDPGPGLRAPFGGLAIGKRSHCTNCMGERIRWYTRSGEVVNRYHYTDGYLHRRATPDDVAPSRREWRQQLVVTLFDQMDGQPQTPAEGRKTAAKRSRPRMRSVTRASA